MAKKYHRSYEKNLSRHSCVCQQCGVTFTATRPDAAYHNNACKCKASRLREKQLTADRIAEQQLLAMEAAKRAEEEKARKEKPKPSSKGRSRVKKRSSKSKTKRPTATAGRR
jgi:hypothetical protein